MKFEMSDLVSSDEYTLVGKHGVLYTPPVAEWAGVKEFRNDGAFPSYRKEITFNDHYLDFVKFNKWDVCGDISIQVSIGKMHLSESKLKRLECIINELGDLFGLYNKYDERYTPPPSVPSISYSEEDKI